MDQTSKHFKFFPFEHYKQPLLPQDIFVRRLIIVGLLDIGVVALWVFLGMLGYYCLEGNMTWTQAFLNASMIAGGMGPVDILTHESAKIFAGFYAIFSGVLILSVFGLLAAPIFHRFLHRFHLETLEKEVEDEEDDGKETSENTN
jgi:hypothetical protein